MQHYPGEILGTLAQLVEQRTFNPFVVGSTPAGPTRIRKAPDVCIRRFFGFYFMIFCLARVPEFRYIKLRLLRYPNAVFHVLFAQVANCGVTYCCGDDLACKWNIFGELLGR